MKHEAPSPGTLFKSIHLLLGHDLKQYWIVLVFAIQAGILSLAIPLAVQSFVNTVSFIGTLQPIILLTVVLLAVLSFSVILQLLQFSTVEKLEQRLFGLNLVRFFETLPTTSDDPAERSRIAMLYWDLNQFRKDMKSIFIEALAILLQLISGLVLITFYHPWFLAFGIILVASLYFLLRWTRIQSISKRYHLSKASHALANYAQIEARDCTHNIIKADELIGGYIQSRQTYFRSVIIQNIGLMVIYVVGSSLLLAIGGLLVVKEQLALGQLVASEIVISTLLYNIWKFGSKIDSIDSFFVSAYKFKTAIQAGTGDTK